MGCRGVHFAVTEDELAALLARPHGDDRLEFLEEEIEERLFEEAPERVCETDKAWDAIHRALTDGSLEPKAAGYPGSAVILGGQSLYDSDDYIVSLKRTDQVRTSQGTSALSRKRRSGKATTASMPRNTP
jgi:hypothetical protein